MQPIFLLVLLLTHVVTSSLFPNTWSRSPSVAYYIVYPVDPSDSTKTTETDITLKDLYGNVDVVPNRQENEITSWSITAQDSDLRDAIKDIEGVLEVEQSDLLEDLPTLSKRSDFVRRDVVSYIASAKDGSDVQKTEEFLRFKVQSGTIINQIRFGDDIVGWGNLALGPDAKTAVQNYEGVEDMMEDEEAVPDRALPASAWLQLSQIAHEALEKKSKLSSRSGT